MNRIGAIDQTLTTLFVLFPALFLAGVFVILSSNIGIITSSNEAALQSVSLNQGEEEARIHILLGKSIDVEGDKVSLYEFITEFGKRIYASKEDKFPRLSSAEMLGIIDLGMRADRCPDEKIALAFYSGESDGGEDSFSNFDICVDIPERESGCKKIVAEDPFFNRKGHSSVFNYDGGSFIVWRTGGEKC